MKAIEKWLKTFYKNHQGAYHYDPTFEQGWRAALEWYYKTSEHLSPSDCDLIDKELEDETS